MSKSVKKPRIKPESTEHEIQVAYFEWLRYAYPTVIAYAIPNGGHRDIRVAVKLKSEGVLAGVPDIFIADGKPGLFIELKRIGGRVSEAQKKVLNGLHEAGYRVAVCYGLDDAITATQFYLKEYYANDRVSAIKPEHRNYVH